MTPEFRQLRVVQLVRALKPFIEMKDPPRPKRGWIRAVREATGVTVREMAKRLQKSPSNVIYLENSEAEYRLTLGNLRDAAEALGCRLVYAFVPMHGSIQELAEQPARKKAAENVRAVEHSMALEDQAVGGVQEKIEEEMKRILQRGRAKTGQNKKGRNK